MAFCRRHFGSVWLGFGQGIQIADAILAGFWAGYGLLPTPFRLGFGQGMAFCRRRFGSVLGRASKLPTQFLDGFWLDGGWMRVWLVVLLSVFWKNGDVFWCKNDRKV